MLLETTFVSLMLMLALCGGHERDFYTVKQSGFAMVDIC